MTPARTLMALATAPGADPLPAGSTCWLCGHPATAGKLRTKWMGANFTDQNKCRDPASPYVCEACIWVCSWVAPPGYIVPPDKAKGPNLRQFSHFYSGGDYAYANKAHKPAIRAWLRAPKSPPWWAAIADSGKKHTLPWTPVNLGQQGAVLFEEQVVRLPTTDAGWNLLAAMTLMLNVRITKAELHTGNYRSRNWATCEHAIRTFEAVHGSARGSAWWALALWLAQRREDYDGRYQAGNDASIAGDTRTVSRKRGEPATALGPDPGSHAGRGTHDGHVPGVDDKTSARPTDCKPAQGDLFADV